MHSDGTHTHEVVRPKIIPKRNQGQYMYRFITSHEVKTIVKTPEKKNPVQSTRTGQINIPPVAQASAFC
jgi:hypothetical protein